MTRLECVKITDGVSVVRGSFVRHVFPMHSHSDFAVCVVSKGFQGFTSAKTNAVLNRQCFASVNPGQIHDGFSVDAKGWNQYVLFFSEQTAVKFADENCVKSTQFCFNRAVSSGTFAGDITARIAETAETEDSLKKQCVFEETLALLHKREQLLVPVPQTGHKPGIKQVIELMHENFENRLNLDYLAKTAGISKFHFIRNFKEHTGLTPHAYLNQIRLDAAFILMKNSDKSYAEIAAECGFSDQSHFLRSFKKLWGTTPGSFIKK